MPKNDGVVENLVTQFSSPLDCFRELAQNAMDAGSPVVEVWCEFIPGEDYSGTIALHVDDWGEGMDEQIIDTYLTQLFSSSKEDDLTKIGKFGIGFVSVFALNPRAVLVQTGRGGEYWEVLFHEDRTFTKSALDMPVEGTQITIFLPGDAQDYAELVQKTHDRLKFWCMHSQIEITFENRTPIHGGFGELSPINEPFEIEGRCVTRVEHQGTEIVCAYQHRPIYGFYNAGLTLALTHIGDDVLGARADRLRRIGFKIKSRYLEHTLSRETIMRDENYEKAMRLLDDAVNQDLFAELTRQIEALVSTADWGLSQAQTYGELIDYLAGERAELIESVAQKPLIRTLYGAAISLDAIYQLWTKDGRVLLSIEPTELSGAVERAGTPVIYGPDNPAPTHPLAAVHGLIKRYLRLREQSSLSGRFQQIFQLFGASNRAQALLAAPEDVYMPVVPDDKPPEAASALLKQAATLLNRIDAGYQRLLTCRITRHDTAPPLFVVADKVGPLMAHPPVGAARTDRRFEAAVNRDHPHFVYLLNMHQTSPRLAAYCLAKSLLLSEDRLLNLDMPMIEAAQA